jgi:hypothetical protein
MPSADDTPQYPQWHMHVHMLLPAPSLPPLRGFPSPDHSPPLLFYLSAM